MDKPHKYTSVDDALFKLQAYCSYQDRCHKEVRTKLISLKIYGDDLDHVITELIREKYLDEERYARSFVRGRFRIKKWGKVKIKMALKFNQVSEYCIKKGMTEIDEDEYLSTLSSILEKKAGRDNFYDMPFKEKQKLTNWAMSRGYEIHLILDLMG